MPVPKGMCEHFGRQCFFKLRFGKILVARVNTEAQAGICLLDAEAELRSGSEDSCNICTILLNNQPHGSKQLEYTSSEEAIGGRFKCFDECENITFSWLT